MKLLDAIFEFKGNIPSICGLRLGESYYENCDLLSSIQDKHTGEGYIDYLLDDYSVFIDVDTNENASINSIIINYIPYEPFSYNDMQRINNFFKKKFGYIHIAEHTDETIHEEEFEYDYSFELSNASYQINVSKSSGSRHLVITISSPKDTVEILQGSNIYYYHEPLGFFAVSGSELGLSMVRHNGNLTRKDVVENLITAMKLSNEYGEDWHFDYAYSFLHQEGMIMPLEDLNLLEDEQYMRSIAEEITDVLGYRGSQAEYILNLAGVGSKLIPVEEYFMDDLLSGNIDNLKEHIKEISSTWTLTQVLPYESLDY